MTTTNKTTNYLPPEMLCEIMSNLDETKELKAENEKLKKQTACLWELLENIGDSSNIELLIELFGEEHIKKIFDEEYAEYKEEKEQISCIVCGTNTNEGTYEFDYNGDTGFYCCKNKNCLREFWGDDASEEEEEEEDV